MENNRNISSMLKRISKEIIFSVFFGTVMIFLYWAYLELLLTLFMPGYGHGTRAVISNTLWFFFMGEVFEDSEIPRILIILVGLPSLATYWMSQYFSNKKNFILLPMLTTITSFLIFPIIYLVASPNISLENLTPDMEESLNGFIYLALLFQLVFVFVIAGWRFLNRKKPDVVRKFFTIINPLAERSDDVFIKTFSILAGVIAGLFIGVWGGTLISALYLLARGHNISGENSLGVAVMAGMYGLPTGVIGGTIISYLKRCSRKWRVVFFILALAWILMYFSPIIISPVGEIARILRIFGK